MKYNDKLQSGFRCHSSTKTALVKVTNGLLMASMVDLILFLSPSISTEHFTLLNTRSLLIDWSRLLELDKRQYNGSNHTCQINCSLST